jgi:homoserine kinase
VSWAQCKSAIAKHRSEKSRAWVDNGSLPPVNIVRVPGSSANLGPGFDALGVALEIWLECRFSPATKLSIRVHGRDADMISPREDNLIWQTALAVAARARKPLPAISLEIINDIPIGKGVGSSAAALTAGVVIAEKLLDLRWKQARILDEAARLEGHPDNVAACVLGSVVASAVEPSGQTRSVRLEMPANFDLAVVIPNYALPTKESRAVLPECYSRADTTFNIQRASLLIAALATGDVSAFPAALDDRMHQPFRAGLVPGLSEILRLRAPGLLGCTLSGAGPGVLVFYQTGYERVCDLVRQVFAMNGCTTEVIAGGVSRLGYQIS